MKGIAEAFDNLQQQITIITTNRAGNAALPVPIDASGAGGGIVHGISSDQLRG